MTVTANELLEERKAIEELLKIWFESIKTDQTKSSRKGEEMI